MSNTDHSLSLRALLNDFSASSVSPVYLEEVKKVAEEDEKEEEEELRGEGEGDISLTYQ